MSIELKIKAMSLTEEAHIIRYQEQRLLRKRRKAQERILRRPRSSNEAPDLTGLWVYDSEFTSIRFHRVGKVREEARLTHLARAFLAGQTYEEVEATNLERNKLTKSQLDRVLTMANRYRPTARFFSRFTLTELVEWIGRDRLGFKPTQSDLGVDKLKAV